MEEFGWYLIMDGSVLETVRIFKYLGSLMTTVVLIEADVQQRFLDRSKVLRALRSVLEVRTMSWGVNKNIVTPDYSPHGHLWR
mgnify:CR=1 FL=1